MYIFRIVLKAVFLFVFNKANDILFACLETLSKVKFLKLFFEKSRLWHAYTCKIEKVSYKKITENKSKTVIAINNSNISAYKQHRSVT